MTKILVIGAGGMLGADVMHALAPHAPRGLTRTDLDIRNESDVAAAVEGFDVVVNTAAYTRVDDAESERELAFAINAEGPRNIARAAHKTQARLIHISTDYVFEGTASSPTPKMPPPTLSRYTGHPNSPAR